MNYKKIICGRNVCTPEQFVILYGYWITRYTNFPSHCKSEVATGLPPIRMWDKVSLANCACTGYLLRYFVRIQMWKYIMYKCLIFNNLSIVVGDVVKFESLVTLTKGMFKAIYWFKSVSAWTHSKSYTMPSQFQGLGWTTSNLSVYFSIQKIFHCILRQ